MIITEKVSIKIRSDIQLSEYKEKGYIVNLHDEIEINIYDLTYGSEKKINVKCDICGKEKEISYRNYNKNIKNGNYYSCSQVCASEKTKETNIEKYGVPCVFQNNKIKDKIKETNIDKYNVDNVSKLDIIKIKKTETFLKNYGIDCFLKTDKCRDKCKISIQSKECKEKSKNTRILNGNQIPDELLTPFKKYRKKVINYTNKYKKELFENWSGCDYYDNEYIKNYTDTKKLPSIDHKISIYYGFINNMSIEIIGGLFNLCITKKTLNSSKGKLTENEYKEKIHKNI